MVSGNYFYQPLFGLSHHIQVLFLLSHLSAKPINERKADLIQPNTTVSQFILSVFDELFIPGVQNAM